MPLDFSSVVEETLQLVKATVSRNIAFSVTLTDNYPLSAPMYRRSVKLL